jgi:hypothetical protein
VGLEVCIAFIVLLSIGANVRAQTLDYVAADNESYVIVRPASAEESFQTPYKGVFGKTRVVTQMKSRLPLPRGVHDPAKIKMKPGTYNYDVHCQGGNGKSSDRLVTVQADLVGYEYLVECFVVAGRYHTVLDIKQPIVSQDISVDARAAAQKEVLDKMTESTNSERRYVERQFASDNRKADREGMTGYIGEEIRAAQATFVGTWKMTMYLPGAKFEGVLIVREVDGRMTARINGPVFDRNLRAAARRRGLWLETTWVVGGKKEFIQFIAQIDESGGLKGQALIGETDVVQWEATKT